MIPGHFATDTVRFFGESVESVEASWTDAIETFKDSWRNGSMITICTVLFDCDVTVGGHTKSTKCYSRWINLDDNTNLFVAKTLIFSSKLLVEVLIVYLLYSIYIILYPKV